MDIGTKLKQARAASNLTQEQATEALGVSRQTISNWETGKTYPDIVSVIKMSDIYRVSLDELLKGKGDSMTDYIEYLEESTDTVRCRAKLRKTVILAVYLGVWALCLIAFWLFARPSDALGYSIVFLWLIMPVVTFVTALLIARDDIWGRRKWLSPLAFGTMLLLVEYGTFSLANMIANDFAAINSPSLSWFLAGAVISLIGLAIGSIGKRH